MKDICPALIKKADDSLKAAELLMENGYYDFAVSRAYYTMFYVAEAVLFDRNLSFSKHSAVISAFGLHFTKTGIAPREFHRFIIEAKDNRNIGDYDTESTLDETEVKTHIERARKILEFGLRYFKK